MTKFWIASCFLAAVALCRAGWASAGDTAKGDKAKLQGKWSLVGGKEGAREIPKEAMLKKFDGHLHLLFEGDAFTINHGGTVKKGTYTHSFTWDGRNWNGPSDTGQPKGPAFPPGTYTLTVTVHGKVILDAAGQKAPYQIARTVKLILK